MLCTFLKLLHVLAAIAAVGATATYGIWIVMGSRDPKVLAFALRGIKVLDDRLATPGFVFLLVTGIVLVLVGRLPVTTPWLLTALVLYVASALLALLVYTPTLKAQIRLLESDGATSPSYKATAGRGRALGIALGTLSVAIVFLMVFKPALWG